MYGLDIYMLTKTDVHHKFGLTIKKVKEATQPQATYITQHSAHNKKTS